MRRVDVLKTAMLKLFGRTLVWTICILGSHLAWGQEPIPTASLLPATTKGYLSIRDFEEFRSKWNQTRFGAMAQDPLLKSFVEDLQEQVKNRLDEAGVRIGLTIDQLISVCGGEVCIGTIEPADAAQKHAVALIVDVRGKEQELEQLLKDLDTNMKQREATKSEVTRGTIKMSVYKVPLHRGPRTSFQAVVFVHGGQLIATDHMEVADHLADRCNGKTVPTLADDVAAFQVTLDRCAKQADTATEPDVVGFFEPLGYARVSREALGTRRTRRTDMIKALEKQGFDALQGIGGTVRLKQGDNDAEFRAFVYAPAVPAAEKDKYLLAARVLRFAGKGDLTPQPWIPANVSSYSSALWDLTGAFDYIGTLVDEVAGQEGFWGDFQDSLREDPSGPMIDLKRDIINHLGDRVTVFSDVVMPIAPESERILVAISLANPAAMEKSINRMMKNDPATEKHEFEGRIIWEIVPEEEDDFGVSFTEGDFVSIGDDDALEDEDQANAEPFLASAAISVVDGHLMISSHVDYIMDIIQRKKDAPALGTEEDLQTIEKSLQALGASETDTLRSFLRLGEISRVSYELLREGKMPESQGLFGQALNRFFASEKKGEKRQQRIKGDKLPPFDKIEKYFGPAGIYVRTEEDGWYMAGLVAGDPAQQVPPAEANEAAISTAKSESETEDK
jgi:hypothetical protein